MMTDSLSVPPEEEQSADEQPGDRFRRLLIEDEKETASGEVNSGEGSSGAETLPLDTEAEGEKSDQIEVDGRENHVGSSRGNLTEGAQTGEDTKPVRVSSSDVPAPPPLGQTPQGAQPAVGTQGLPLPRRIAEIDTEATRVSQTAYSPTNSGVTVRSSIAPPTHSAEQPPYAPPPPNQSAEFNWRKGLGCFLRIAVLSLFLISLVVLCAGSLVLYQYYSIARELPNVQELRLKASQFETTRIYDRNGNVLYEILDPNAGRRTYVTLDKVSPYLVAATIATEDKEFYSHPGFDVLAILRAFLQNYQSGEIVSGASTITQQLARNLLFTSEERSLRTYERKIREAVLAAEITRVYSKDEILELYLNESYYGNLAYGVEAAAQTYFGTSADKLSLSQAAFLAGLPQAPYIYDVYTNPESTLKRQEDVLVLMYEASQEQGCIYVSNNPQRVCMDPVAAATAATELKSYQFNTPDVQLRYPHWVNYIRTLLEAQYDPQTIYRSGFSVYTTLDPGLQEAAQNIISQQVANLADRHATNGALVAIRPTTGEILAMVGSADFYDESISGQVNMAVSPRQPGSAMKPLTYTAAFEKGWTPATLIWDVPSEFTPSGQADDPGPTYIPTNYDEKFHGPVRVRSALANSYNIPAIKTLKYIGIYDDPETPQEDGMVAMARRLGISTLNRPDYGLSLTLGGGEVTLLELTGAYATYANSGRRVPLVAITQILDYQGNLVYQHQPVVGEQVIRPEHAYLISDILSDNRARTPAFGSNSVLYLPFQVAAKTGTTNDFRDNWTLGYTPDVAVGAWVGNADYTPMQNISGVQGAAPVWSEFMQIAVQQLTGGQATPFSRPGGVVEKVICEVSGTEPSQWCPEQSTELFAADQPPLPKDQDLWQKTVVDTWTGFEASDDCSEFTDELFTINVSDTWAKKWIRKEGQGKNWAEEMGFEVPVTFTPSRECRADDPRPILSIKAPEDGETIRSNPLSIFGQAYATSWFDFYELYFGLGAKPVKWELLQKKKSPVNDVEELFEWDLKELPAGEVTLRLYMHSKEDTHAELKVSLNLQVPTPTPTPTNTPTPTPTPTNTPTPTLTPTPTNTSLPTSTPTVTPHLPKATRTFTPSPTIELLLPSTTPTE